MKTAMQELEDKLKDNLQWIVMNADYELMEKLFKEGFEKEKEQIIAPINYYKKQSCTAFDDDYIHTGEDYYNQIYNQNK